MQSFRAWRFRKQQLPADIALGGACHLVRSLSEVCATCHFDSPLGRDELFGATHEVAAQREPLALVLHIRLEVGDTAERDRAFDLAVEQAEQLDGTGIVYVPTRAGATDMAARIDRPDRPAVAYHAGSSRDKPA